MLALHLARWLVPLLTLPLTGCPGEATLPDQGRRDSRFDLPAMSSEGRPGRADLPEVCGVFAREGQSCAAEPCPAGLIPAVLDGKSCTCHVPCNPDQSKRCQPEVCGRVCVQLTDSGNPLPGQGACQEDKGGTAGEPCPPVCQLELDCIQHGPVGFCRSSCTGPSDCTGFKMVCVPLTATDKVCVPGGSTTGPKLGESCSGADAYCVQGLLCDPQTLRCLSPCSPSSPCAAPATCSKLTDSTGVVTGYGCR